jgi:hypothetical protein
MKCEIINKTEWVTEQFKIEGTDSVMESGKYVEAACGGEMEEKGETGGSIKWVDDEGCGIRRINIYQCRQCKDIQIV